MRILNFSIALMIAVGACTAATAQDETKSIRAPEYVKARPAGPSVGGGAPTGALSYVKVRVRPRKPVAKVIRHVPPKQSETARLGFTVWRVDTTSGGVQPKSLTEQDSRTAEGRRLERIDSDSALAIGDSVRIGIETLTHKGYLYVVDREKYADGTFGEPTLLYPTLRYRGGDNFVRPGDVTFLPGANREIILRADTAKRQVAEELTIIISPTRLIEPSQLQMDQIKLSPNQLLTWINSWAAKEVQYDQIDTTGKSLTQRESAAGGDQTKGLHEQPLSQSDPLPQTMLEMKIKRGNPLITAVTLPIKQN